MQMSTILFLTDAWAPKPSTNVVCIQKVISCLPREQFRVICSAFSQDGKQESLVEDGIVIDRILPPKARQFYYLSDLETDIKKKKRAHLLANCLSKIGRIRSIFAYPHPNPAFSQKWAVHVENLIAEYAVDIVVSVISPFESLLAGEYIKKKHPKIKWLIYMLDNGAHQEKAFKDITARLKIFLERHAMKEVRRSFSHADKIFIMEGHKKHYFQDFYQAIWDKFEIVNVPMISRDKPLYRPATPIPEFTPDKTNWVYLGNLGGGYYDPAPICEFFQTYGPQHQAELHFFGRGNDVECFVEYEKASNGAIQYHGLLAHDKIQDVLSCADVLTFFRTIPCVGLISSKFFEYMIAEKPIIYFTYEGRDVNIPYVKQYPGALIVPFSLSTQEKSKLIQQFLKNFMPCPYEKAREIFYSATPEASANAIMRAVAAAG